MNRIKYQEDEANRIYGRLFEKDGNSEESVSHRYLLADEVGLGKTIVAAMVIAKLAVDRMNKGESVRVAYICSNGALANENIRKLKEKIRSIGKDVYGKEINIDDRSSDRLSLEFRNAWNPPEKKTESSVLQLHTITPSTTIHVSTKGTAEERVFAYYLLMGRKERKWIDDGDDSGEFFKYMSSCVNDDHQNSVAWDKALNVFQKEWGNKSKNESEEKENFLDEIAGSFCEKFRNIWEKSNDDVLSLFIDVAVKEMPRDKVKNRNEAVEKIKNWLDRDYTPPKQVDKEDILKVSCLEQIYSDMYEAVKKSVEESSKNDSESKDKDNGKNNGTNNAAKKIEIKEQSSVDCAILDSFKKTIYKTCMSEARRCMVEISLDKMDMDFFIADEIQNYSDIFRSKLGNASDTDYSCLMDHLIKKSGDSRLLMMSATPFRYHSLMNALENPDKDIAADGDPLDDYVSRSESERYLGTDTDIYGEFKSIVGYLAPQFDLEKWEELNRQKRDILEGLLENDPQGQVREDVQKKSEDYKKIVRCQSDMLTAANISRVERYKASVRYGFYRAERELPIDDVLRKELESSPHVVRERREKESDICYEEFSEDCYDCYCYDECEEQNSYDEPAKVNLDYIKSTPAVLSFGCDYARLGGLKDARYKEGQEHSDYQPLRLYYEDVGEHKQLFGTDGANGDETHMLYNARINRLYKKLFDEEQQHRLLFIPPSGKSSSIPIDGATMKLSGVYAGKRGLSKRLFFSDYRMTPKSLSALITYEAERRVMNDLEEKYLGKRCQGYKNIKDKEHKEEYRESIKFDLFDNSEAGGKESCSKLSITLNDLMKNPKTELEDKNILASKLFHHDRDTSIPGKLRKGSVYDYAMFRRGRNDQELGDQEFKYDTAVKKLCEAYYGYMCRKSSLRVILAYYDLGCEESGKKGQPSIFEAILKYGEQGCIWDVLEEYSVYCRCAGASNTNSFTDSFKSVMDIQFHTVKADTNDNSRCSSRQDMNTDFATGHFYGDRSTNGSAAKTLENKIIRFNSPFWPFQFITTSIGQEGFDFHVYCRKVVHWSLECDPVKFEQREGRINRYQSYANRLRLAELMDRKNIRFRGWRYAFDDVRKNDAVKDIVKQSLGLFPDFVVGDTKNADDPDAEGVKYDKFGLESECYYYPFSFESHEFDKVLRCVGYYRSLLGQSGDDTFEKNFAHFLELNKTDNKDVKPEDYFIDLYPSGKIINATPKDKEELLSLYHAMIGGPCEWSENYPDENTIAFDLKNEDLFVMKNDKEEIVATISIDHDDAVEALTCWRADLAPSGELSRLCVRKDMQGQGIAKTMMNYASDVLKSRGMKGVHILVREGHEVAISTYAKIGFETVGECDLFDKHFICMERGF